ncbi:hypothetical protein H4R35_003597 [Dimargaris xerosporica]|nr:hypothetical protein H4R35_003597 [Dimargaris xerosporica]
MAGLRRLSVQPVATEQQLPLTQAAHWRMNLCAITQRQPLPLLFIGAKIHVYPLLTDCAIPAQPSRILWVPTGLVRREQPEDPSHADDTINAIKVAPLDDTEVLVAVNDQGIVCLWQVSSLQKPWLILDNEVSTWGVDIHAELRLLAVSNNDHNILVMELPACSNDSLPSQVPSRLPVSMKNAVFGTLHPEKPSEKPKFWVDEHMELQVSEEPSATDSEDGMVFEELEPDHYLWRRRSSITNSPSARPDHSERSGRYSPYQLFGESNVSRLLLDRSGVDGTDEERSQAVVRLGSEYDYEDENLRSDIASESSWVPDNSASRSSLPPVRVTDSIAGRLPSAAESTSLADVIMGLLEGRPLSLDHPRAALPAVSASPVDAAVSGEMLGPPDRPWMLLHGNTRGLSLLSTLPSFPVIFNDDFIVARSYTNQYIASSSYWRLNMIEWIPELGVAIVACQMGKLALVRLMKDSAPAATTNYTCYVEQYLPAEGYAAPRQRLLGFCVSHRAGHDPQLRRYLVYFVYTDGAYFIYELGQSFSPLTSPLYNLL